MTQQIKPDLTLNMDEKIYLAASKNTDNKIAFVYTLACLKMPNGDFNGLATREVHAFQDKSAAQIFYAAIKQIIALNMEDKNKESIISLNENLIKGFNENVR